MVFVLVAPLARLVMKRTYQPSNRRRKRTHGFRARMATPGGRNVLKRRRAKGRKRLTTSLPPKHARLRKRGEYVHVQESGRRLHTAHFVVLSAPPARGRARIGITVSSRVGNAVVRNRVKRIVREVVRCSWRRIASPADFVVIA